MDKPVSLLTGNAQNLSSDRLESKTIKNDELGQEQFLELMLTQLKNQDPLNPTESGEFLSQIAQFGTVNGISELQQSFSSLAASLQSNQALQASTMVGRSVLIDHDKVSLTTGGTAGFAVELPYAASNLKLSIEDQFGQTVRQFDVGNVGSGIKEFVWDGITSTGEAAASGRYTVRATAVVNGENQAFSTLVQAPVESVSLSRDGGEPILNLPDIGGIALNSVRRVL